jgi:Matrixin
VERGDAPDGHGPPEYWATGEAPSPPPSVPGSSGRHRALVTSLGASLAVLALIGWVVLAKQPPKLVADVSRGTWIRITDVPPPSSEEQAHALGSPPAPPGLVPNGDFRFLQTQSDGTTPVAYDPCRPLHFVAPEAHAPAGAHALVLDAVAQVSAATGLTFVEDPATDEPPQPAREAYQPDRYGKRWAPLLIAWVTAAENPDFDGAAVGEGGSIALSADDGQLVYVTGQIELDSEEFADLGSDEDVHALARSTVMHELGHVVGLDHVGARDELMYPELVRGVTDFGTGDRTGLALLGRGSCFPDV